MWVVPDAVIVTVAALLATFVTDSVIPAGALSALVPVALENHCIVPVAPLAMFAVVTVKVAVPAVPSVIVPDCAPTATVFTSAAGVAETEASSPAPIALTARTLKV